MLDPTKKRYLMSKTNKKPQQDGRKGKIKCRIKPIPVKDTGKTQTKPCVPRAQRPPIDIARPAFECLLQRHGSAVACPRDRGSGCSRPGRHGSVWHKCSWKRLPLPHHKATKQTTHKLENNYIKEVLTLLWKFKGPQQIYQPGHLAKGTENSQIIWFLRPGGFNHRASTGLGKQTLGSHKQNLVHTRTQEKGAVNLQETEPDLP